MRWTASIFKESQATASAPVRTFLFGNIKTAKSLRTIQFIAY